MDIKINKTNTPKMKPSQDTDLGFGTIFTDHMFIMDYNEEEKWHNPRIEKYGDISISPSAMVFHYGQSMFEGMKAYKSDNNKVYLFRPTKNIERANNSNVRLCMPTIPEKDFLQAIEELVKVDSDWIPTNPGESLYIRPVMIATEESLHVSPSKEYKFMIVLSPVGAYYKEGLKPVKIWVEDEYVRAIRGGIGEAKTGGNYAASMAAQEKATQEGYSQVLWTDGIDHKYIEEVGAMNIFFKIDGKIVTPKLNGSILPGVTRDSVIQVCKDMGYVVEERKISVDELQQAAEDGTLEEVFGSGTAAVISPVGTLKFGKKVYTINDGEIGEVSQTIYDTITGIQTGKIEDKFGWRIAI